MSRNKTERLSNAKKALDEVYAVLLEDTKILDEAEAAVNEPHHVYERSVAKATVSWATTKEAFDVALSRLAGS